METTFATELVNLLENKAGLPGFVSMILAKVILVVAVIVATAVVLRVLRWLITGVGLRFLARHLGEKSRPRAITLVSLFYSIAKYVLLFFSFITALSQAGVDTTPFLAGAAVIGLAVSFGSQDLVKDIITGVFVLLEDQFTLGEFVDLGGKSGRVVAMSIRMVTIQDAEGRLHNIAYRSITIVTNFSRAAASLVVDVFVAGAEQEKKGSEIVDRALSALALELPQAVRGVQVEGIINASTAFSLVRARVRLETGQGAFVQAQVLQHVKKAFLAEGIELTDDRIRFQTQG